jgi:multidrug transporter EmrE-like cation transporter
MAGAAARTLADETIVRLRSVPVERTPQRLDPLGAQSAWLIVPIAGLVAVAYALFSTFVHREQLRDPALAVVALGLLALTALVAAVRTHPSLAPVGRWTHLSVVGTALVSACLFDAAVWGRNERIQDDWGQFAVGLFLAVMPLYRPVVEVLGAAALCSAVLGALAASQAPSLVLVNDPLVYATVAATPVLALAAAGSGYAWTMTGETLRWREIARAGQARLEGELRQTARRMVEQERMTVLNAEAVPFLADLLGRGEVTAADAERAGRIAERVRAASVAAVDRTWLAETVDLALAQRAAAARDRTAVAHDDVPGDGPRVEDPGRLSGALPEEQRAIVGALLASVAALPGLRPETLHFVVSGPDRPTFVLTAAVRQPAREVRRALLPFLSALRSVSLDAHAEVRDGELTVRFQYPGTRRR